MLCWVSVYFVFVSRSAVAVRKEPVEISLGISAAGNKTCRRKRREKLLLSMPVPRTGLGGPVAAAMQCRCALCYPFRCQILSCHCFGGCVVLLFSPAPAAACNSRSQHETTILFDRQSRRNKQYTFCASAAQHRLYLLLCTQLLLCRFHVSFALFHFHHTQTLSVLFLSLGSLLAPRLATYYGSLAGCRRFI